MATTSRRAGGRATEAGMAFQAAVGTWFAAHLLAQAPVGARFGLHVAAYPVSLRLETGTGLDDILVGLSDGGQIALQCKTNPPRSPAAGSELGDTIRQTVAFASTLSAADESRASAVMAVSPTAPATLNSLDQACRMFATGGNWTTVYSLANQHQKEALDIFRAHVVAGRLAGGFTDTSDDDVVRLAKLFRIERFAGGTGAADWREASVVLGTRVFGGAEYGPAPLGALLTIVRSLIASGAPSDRDGLLRLLRAAGHEDTAVPQFDDDLRALREVTSSELGRLERHTQLPIAGGLPIPRECLADLRRASEAASFLVVGDPGAGKTGALVSVVLQRLQEGLPTVLLSVDEFAGVASADALRAALGLQHDLVEALAAWPGSARGVLVIDALDASRGGPAEAVFSRIISQLQTQLQCRWSVVASIRTFDLRNSRRVKDVMRGDPPVPAYAEPLDSGVRHFKVPALSPGELAYLSGREVRLNSLLSAAPASVLGLLRNVFNLSLAAALLESGTQAASIAMLATQTELIDRYEDERLSTSEQQGAVRRAIAEMVSRRRLVLRRVDVDHPALDDVLGAGVLVASGDRVSFAHHVLFDHAAGRFLLDWNDTTQLASQLSGSDGVGFLLGPALRFAIERVWRDDAVGRPVTWSLLLALTAAENLDPVIESIALRSVAEQVVERSDTQGLCALLRSSVHFDRVGPLLSKLVRFANMVFTQGGAVSASVAAAWADVAQAAAESRRTEYADGVRILLMALIDKAEFSDATFAVGFGRASRELLAMAWERGPTLDFYASNAIRFVARSFFTDVPASRDLLQQILDEPRFSARAHEEAPLLADGVKHIVEHDPEFVVSVYAALYGRPAPSEGDSWMGGHVSRIMPLRSSRVQDYEFSRWYLEQALPNVLASSAVHGTRAVSAAAVGSAENAFQRMATTPRPRHVVPTTQGPIEVVEDGLSHFAWRTGEATQRAIHEHAPLRRFVDFLVSCSPESFRAAIAALKGEPASASAWARIFGVAADRVGVADDLLWPIASSAESWGITDLARDAITYLVASYATRPVVERTTFETQLVRRSARDGDDGAQATRFAARFLSSLQDEAILTAELHDLKARLALSGALTGNRPITQMGLRGREAEAFDDLVFASRGIDLQSTSNQSAVLQTRSLAALLRREVEGESADSLGELWQQVLSSIAAVDALEQPPHDHVLWDFWAKVSNAMERLAKAQAYDPSRENHPSLDQAIPLLDRLAQSPHPAEVNGRASMSWSNADIRVYAASAFMHLTMRWGSSDSTLMERIGALLGDPAATVRHQISGFLNTLWNVDRDRMWQLMERVANEESNAAAIAHFLAGPLTSVRGEGGDRAEGILFTVLDRFPAPTIGESQLDQVIGDLVADLYVWEGRARCGAYLAQWLADVDTCHSRLYAAITQLRAPLFLRFRQNPPPDWAQTQERARGLLHRALTAAAEALGSAATTLNDVTADAQSRMQAERRYGHAAQLLELACNQLYFGAGVFRNHDDPDPLGLPSVASKQQFLIEYETVLDAIGRGGPTGAIHHLVELYEFLLDAAPETVFDKVSALLVGPATQQAYHLESLGNDVIVRMVRRYLADYRAIFEDATRRAALVGVLRLFSNVGWPEALALLYELPNLLR